MIGGLRRRFSGNVEHIWSINQELEPEVSVDLGSHSGTAVLFTTTKPASERETNDVSMKEYYKAVLGTAIERGGWYQGQTMSLAWLRMTLAGLESKPLPPEALWEEQASATCDSSRAMPSYEDLFPEEKSLAKPS
ncbi:MAG: hypothetical protein JRN62_01810 [Nitrososphaerota archaeon]|nr:hypothetical protein [Nitrososphaerota archaeon]